MINAQTSTTLPDVTEAMLQDLARRGTQKWQETVATIIAFGQFLIDAKVAAGHGNFSRLFKDHAKPVDPPMPITQRTGEKVMKIAKNPALANPTNWSSLPIATDTLDVLSPLPEKFIESYIARGFVSPDMTGIDARALRYGRKDHLTRMAQAIQAVKAARAGQAELMEHIGFANGTAVKVHYKRLQRRELTESCHCQCSRCGSVHPDERLRSKPGQKETMPGPKPS
jgi:hypothetical protein